MKLLATFRARPWAAVLAVLLWAAVAGAMWIVPSYAFQADRVITVPLAPSQAIRVWPRVLPERGYGMIRSTYFHAPVQLASSLWLGLWYENTVTGATTRLATFMLPMWLLRSTALGSGLAAILLCLAAVPQTANAP